MPDRGPVSGPRISGVTAAVLAGGLGTRLRPVCPDRQKVLAEVSGRPFVTHILDRLNAAGIPKVVLCTGYRGEQVREVLGEAYGGMRLVYSQEPSPLGTAGALRLALPLLDSDPVLVMNGDSVGEVGLEGFLSLHRLRKAQATVMMAEASDMGRYGRVILDPDGRVAGFEEKSASSGPGWVSAGVYLMSRSLISNIPSERAVSLEREMFPAWIGRGLYGDRGSGRFLDIGTPEDFETAQGFFLREA